MFEVPKAFLTNQTNLHVENWWLMLIRMRLTITTTAAAFKKNDNFDECVLQEISGACVDTKLRCIEATCIVSGDKG